VVLCTYAACVHAHRTAPYQAVYAHRTTPYQAAYGHGATPYQAAYVHRTAPYQAGYAHRNIGVGQFCLMCPLSFIIIKIVAPPRPWGFIGVLMTVRLKTVFPASMSVKISTLLT